MTDYLTYTPAEYAPDAPATALHFQRWFENWIAGFEGAAGAPRLRGAAMYGPVAGAVVLRNCLPFGSEVATTSIASTPATTRVECSGFTALVACTVRVFLTFTKGGPQTIGLNVLKNGASVQAYSTAQTGVTVDVTLAAGDTLGVVLSASTNTNGAASTITLTACQYRVDQRSAVMT